MPVSKILAVTPVNLTLRAKLGGHRLVHIGVAIFSDETSGNTSKRYNLFENLFFTLCTISQCSSGWPIGLLCSAKDWTALELMELVVDDLLVGMEGFWAYDGHMNEPVFVRLKLLACLADNPRANQLCTVMQSTTLHYCRYCMSRRTTPLRVCAPRDKEMTISQLQQIRDRILQPAQCGLHVGLTPLFRVPDFDPHRGSPLELLHLLPLGIVKYVATLTKEHLFSKMNSDARDQVVKMFDAAPVYPGHRVSGERVLRWVGSMVGKDFRYLARVAALVLHGLVPHSWVRLWFWTGQVLSYAYVHEIARSKLDRYCAALDFVIGQFFQASAAIKEATYIGTLKAHLLLHLSAHVRRFGPLRMWMTERLSRLTGPFDVKYNGQTGSNQAET
ncbi:hypothetical protein RI367_002900 [Sorochytrium milnesiophthora]